MLLIPTRVETLMERWPWGNFFLIGATIAVSLAAWADFLPMHVLEEMILDDWEWTGLLGSQLLHADVFHLLFNMVFLWVFGNTVCAKIGNLAYIPFYLLLGTVAGAAHLSLDAGAAIGASGAVNGIIGFYFFLHPTNRIHCFWWFWIRAGTFDIPGYWLILGWLALDFYGAFSGGAGVAYWAHLGGFFAGFLLAFLGLISGLVKMTAYDNGTLLDLLRPRSASD